MVSAGSYLLGAVQLALVLGPISFAAWRLRCRLLPSWTGAPARLVESIAAVALLIWISEVLGTFGLFYAGALIAAALLVAGTVVLWPAGPAAAGDPPSPATAQGAVPPTTSPTGEGVWALCVMAAVIAITVFSWAVTTKHAVDRGIFNFDSLWYHMPFAADMAQSHSVVGMDHVETVFTNWFYPQNSELLHAAGILLIGRDTLSLFINFGWLAVAFLAAYCIGRPYGRGPLSVVAAAVLLDCHTLVVREPGAAKNDVMAAALILAAIAVLVTVWARWKESQPSEEPGSAAGSPRARRESRGGAEWGVAAAGLAVGLAAGTKFTVM